MKTQFQDRIVKILNGIKGEAEVRKVMESNDLPFNFARIVDGETRVSVINEKFYQDYTENPREVRKINAVEMKGGKFLMKLFPDASHQEIHQFLAKLQGGTVEIVKGEDIRFWYNGKNYTQSESTDTLGASCMKHAKCQPWFDIYVKNPDVCSLAVMKADDDLLKGRALLWNCTDSEGNEVKVMDRIYGTNKTTEVFKAWAKKNGYYHKVRQTYSDYTLVNADGHKITAHQLEIHGDFKASHYPYMDTFDKVNGARTKLSHKEAAHSLKSTGGGHG